jgi:D-threo-aldose 1-dehydrogenase
MAFAPSLSAEFCPMTKAFAQRQLGTTSVKVSALGLGGAPIGGFRFALSDQQGMETVRAAADAGITYFDTSPYYGYGRSEHLYGFALRSRPRDSYVLSTKVGRWMTPLREGETPPEGWRSGGLPFWATYDYSRDGTLRSLEQSMLRLGLSRIDVALIHDVDVWTHGSQAEADRRFKETMAGCYPALAELRRAGVIRAIGVGLNETAMSLRFAREADIDCVMLAGRYTLLEQGALDGLLPHCERKGMSILLAAPLNSGILAVGAREGATYDYKPAPPAVLDKVSRIEAVCRRHGVALSAAALQFPLAHPRIASIVAGATKPAEVLENIARMAAPIPADLWRELKHEELLAEAAPIPA